MNCNEARRRWHLRFDDGESDNGLELHCQVCTECRMYGAKMSRLLGELDDLRRGTEELVSRRTTGYEDSKSAKSDVPRRMWIGPAARVAASIVLLVGAGVLYRAFSQPRDGSGKDVPPSRVATLPSEDAPRNEQSGHFGMTLHGASAERLIVVPKPGVEPGVQVYWLYSVVRDRAESSES